MNDLNEAYETLVQQQAKEIARLKEEVERMRMLNQKLIPNLQWSQFAWEEGVLSERRNWEDMTEQTYADMKYAMTKA
tara:strand:+ start:143 stop:373 length:231 start_codon:yes stop_codon:yes gene_type:complete